MAMLEERKQVRGLRVGVAGPVGSGKTTLVECLSRTFSETGYEVAVVTNDIYTQEDAEFLRRRGVLPLERVRGWRQGGVRTRRFATMPR